MKAIKNKLVYYVASSIDGYIAGVNEDISAFMAEGKGIQKYLNDLKKFETVIMGRKTYEFGYKFGLEPGEAPYPHMRHYIFSNTLKFDKAENNVRVLKPDLLKIDEIINRSSTDVYLCGGGMFAGWLLDNQRIDILKLKINPMILGKGIRLFGNSEQHCQFELLQSEGFHGGLQINTYKIKYSEP